MNQSWTAGDMAPQDGKRILVTGGTSGIGLATAKALANAGANLILAAEEDRAGERALAQIRAEAPDAEVEFVLLDLADLASVNQVSEQILAGLPSLDVLVNCAGVGGRARREVTVNGLERLFATNFLGHFALTARLLPLLNAAPDPRIVPVSSLASRKGKIDFSNLQSERRYQAYLAYAQSKLAILMFGLELHRRAQAAGLRLRAIPVHPGTVSTEIYRRAMGARSVLTFLTMRAIRLLGQEPDRGALPLLFAATAPEAESGVFYGPDGFAEMRGLPRKAWMPPRALDADTAQRLWEAAEELSGVRFELMAPAGSPGNTS